MLFLSFPHVFLTIHFFLSFLILSNPTLALLLYSIRMFEISHLDQAKEEVEWTELDPKYCLEYHHHRHHSRYHHLIHR